MMYTYFIHIRFAKYIPYLSVSKCDVSNDNFENPIDSLEIIC